MLIDVPDLRPLDKRNVRAGIGLSGNGFAQNGSIHRKNQIANGLDTPFAMSAPDPVVVRFVENGSVMPVILPDHGSIETDGIDRPGRHGGNVQFVAAALQ